MPREEAAVSTELCASSELGRGRTLAWPRFLQMAKSPSCYKWCMHGLVHTTASASTAGRATAATLPPQWAGIFFLSTIITNLTLSLIKKLNEILQNF